MIACRHKMLLMIVITCLLHHMVTPIRIVIRIVDEDGTVEFYKIKVTKRLVSALMDVYCNRRGVAVGSVRFIFDGNEIQPHHTAEILGIEDDNSIFAESS